MARYKKGGFPFGKKGRSMPEERGRKGRERDVEEASKSDRDLFKRKGKRKSKRRNRR